MTVLNQIYEEDSLGFLYGFRPERNQHHTLDALRVGNMRKQVNWIPDADVRGFFDNFSHEWLVKFYRAPGEIRESAGCGSPFFSAVVRRSSAESQFSHSIKAPPASIP